LVAISASFANSQAIRRSTAQDALPHPFDAVPVLRLLQQTIEAFDGSSEAELRLRFSNGDRLTVARDDGPEGFTIHHIGQPLIVG